MSASQPFRKGSGVSGVGFGVEFPDGVGSLVVHCRVGPVECLPHRDVHCVGGGRLGT